MGASAPLKMAIEFYGLEVKEMQIQEGSPKNEMLGRMDEVMAVVVNARALLSLSWENFFRGLPRKVPVLIFGVNPKTSCDALFQWSKGQIVGVDLFGDSQLTLQIANNRKIAGPLSGLEKKILGKAQPSSLRMRSVERYEAIVSIRNMSQADPRPIMAMMEIEGRKLFFLTKTGMENQRSIEEYLPFLLFLKYAGGERCWRTPGHYANLTIDDPWLTEPYGFLSFRGLLREMEREGFHTTIAFVPWNYDRSKKEVIEIFREHPYLFSLSIHGDDHNHREFYKDDSEKKQEAKIGQALARMEVFRKTTGLPYDRVMVFPHGMAPEMTVGLIKKYNFLATANAMPIGFWSDEFVDAHNGIRSPVHLMQNLPTLWRHPPYGREPWDIALDLFLGKPVLFYTHHDFFERGSDAFNPVARLVNQIEPGIEWQSLGFIARNLFLQRRKVDGDWDVRAFTNCIVVRNTDRVESTFWVRKADSFFETIGRVTVDEKEIEYGVTDGEVRVVLRIPPGESRRVQIEYVAKDSWRNLDPSKSLWGVYILRYISDFRDLWLSRIPFGINVTRIYYRGDIWIVVSIFIFLGAVLGLGFYWQRRRRT